MLRSEIDLLQIASHIRLDRINKRQLMNKCDALRLEHTEHHVIERVRMGANSSVANPNELVFCLLVAFLHVVDFWVDADVISA